VACAVAAASNDKEQAVPMAQAALGNLEGTGIERPTDATGQALPIPNLTDSRSSSAQAAQGLAGVGVDPYPAAARQRQHGRAAAPGATAQEAMAAKLRTPVGWALHALRKVMVEPVFGQITGARGLRRVLRRGLTTVNGERPLVCLTHNLLKI